MKKASKKKTASGECGLTLKKSSAERAGRQPIQQYHPPRKVPQGMARRAPDANASPILEQTANVAYAPSMPLAGDGDDIVTSAPYTPTRKGKHIKES